MISPGADGCKRLLAPDHDSPVERSRALQIEPALEHYSSLLGRDGDRTTCPCSCPPLIE
jgi:hypothetical protein